MIVQKLLILCLINFALAESPTSAILKIFKERRCRDKDCIRFCDYDGEENTMIKKSSESDEELDAKDFSVLYGTPPCEKILKVEVEDGWTISEVRNFY
jgi:hypothetical protein